MKKCNARGSAARDPHGIKQITVGPPHGIKQITTFIRENVDAFLSHCFRRHYEVPIKEPTSTLFVMCDCDPRTCDLCSGLASCAVATPGLDAFGYA
ncbi:hypothetical protein J6590_056926 [Homalodisca vitripennis]|nr:hypothetical protein J6590_056926 [Homalodisca vitripennis]